MILLLAAYPELAPEDVAQTMRYAAWAISE